MAVDDTRCIMDVLFMNRLFIASATVNHAVTISELAERIWWPTYRRILPADQIKFMLERLFLPSAIIRQMKSGTKYFLARLDEVPVGFLALKAVKNTLHIDKIYIESRYQKQGIGKKLLQFSVQSARRGYYSRIELNVNRRNSALAFYERLGFHIVASIDTPYGDFILDDYVLRLNRHEFDVVFNLGEL